ncbi:MerR family transcriptional regulator [Alkalicoccobacillus gibsonii]|uniref:MerR family transcriptional regulator n=1 Tax=Alkalicoccobacillus gibsonii TaxID=79881 RepID=UPI003F7B9AA5
MTSRDGKYNIKAISTKLGIQPGTLRAWERRYKVIQPTRNAAGHRLYSEQQLHVLHWLIEKVNQGFTIGQAVELFEKDKKQSNQTAVQINDDYTYQLACEIKQALLQFNEYEASQLLNKAFSLYSIEKVAQDVLGVIYQDVKALKEANQITAAHEYVTASFVETKIKHLFLAFPIDGRLPRVVTWLYGKEKQNSLQWLLFALFLRQKGLEVINLGEGISLDDVETMIREVNPGMLVTFYQSIDQIEPVSSIHCTLDKLFPRVGLAIGGEKSLQHVRADLVPIGSGQIEWDEWLNNWLSSP